MTKKINDGQTNQQRYIQRHQALKDAWWRNNIKRTGVWKKAHRDRVRESESKYRRSASRKYVHLKARSKSKGYPFTMTKEDFLLWFGNQFLFCHYCDIEISICHPTKRQRLTFDRKDNSGFYTLDNMVLACYRCNAIKSDDISYEIMLKIGQLLKMNRLLSQDYANMKISDPSELAYGGFHPKNIGMAV